MNPRDMTTLIHKDLYVSRSFIHNNKKAGSNPNAHQYKRDQCVVVYSLKGILLTTQKEQTTHIYNMDEAEKYYTEQKTPDTKDRLCDAICSDRSRAVVSRGGEGGTKESTRYKGTF